tara:strand:- start:558 stop:1919 length:1362 start_codon:yes stop_codon:yes gene_type:complete
MFKLESKFHIALISFRAGIFLLASAPFFAAFFLLGSLSYGLFLKRKEILRDKWNYLFIVASLLMIIISIIQSLEFNNLSISELQIEGDLFEEKITTWNSHSSLIGLSNWIPLFLCFYGFQPYLSSSNNRKIAAKFFVTGSVPVLIAGFGQYFFNWYGPFETMKGLIIWYQRDTGSGISSLFNNQNYAGCWLNIVLPFSIAIFFEKTKNIFQRGSSFIFIITISLASFLTTSRNAWGGLFLTVPLMLGYSSFYWIVPIIVLFSLLILLKILNYFPASIDLFLNSFLPDQFNIINQFSPENYTNSIYNRNTIFLFALNMIYKSPLIGFGAATFPIYYYMQNDIYIGHPHNLIIELAFSYGFIVASTVFINIFLLSYFSIKEIYFSKYSTKLKNIFFERSWCTSFIILLFSQMFDVQYFDLRISISFWILLAGMRCIINNASLGDNDSQINLLFQN